MTNKDLAWRAQCVASMYDNANCSGLRIALVAEIALRTTSNVAEARGDIIRAHLPQNIASGAVDLISTLTGGRNFTRRTP